MDIVARVALANSILEFIWLGLDIISKCDPSRLAQRYTKSNDKRIHRYIFDLETSISRLNIDVDDDHIMLQGLCNRCKEVGERLTRNLKMFGGWKFSSSRFSPRFHTFEDIEAQREQFEALREKTEVHLRPDLFADYARDHHSGSHLRTRRLGTREKERLLTNYVRLNGLPESIRLDLEHYHDNQNEAYGVIRDALEDLSVPTTSEPQVRVDTQSTSSSTSVSDDLKDPWNCFKGITRRCRQYWKPCSSVLRTLFAMLEFVVVCWELNNMRSELHKHRQQLQKRYMYPQSQYAWTFNRYSLLAILPSTLCVFFLINSYFQIHVLGSAVKLRDCIHGWKKGDGRMSGKIMGSVLQS